MQNSMQGKWPFPERKMAIFQALTFQIPSGKWLFWSGLDFFDSFSDKILSFCKNDI